MDMSYLTGSTKTSQINGQQGNMRSDKSRTEIKPERERWDCATKVATMVHCADNLQLQLVYPTCICLAHWSAWESVFAPVGPFPRP